MADDQRTPNPPPNPPQPQIIQLSPEATTQLLNPSISPQQIATLVPNKLTPGNYVLWRSLLTPVLQQYNLYGIATCTKPCPNLSLPNSVEINPAYTEWLKRDRTCRIWLTATLSDAVLPFQTLEKGSLSMQAYLQQLKEITDSLAHAGEPISDTDIVAHMLHGLPPDYDSLATSIRVRAEPILPEELHGFLLSEHVEITRRSQASLPHLNPNNPNLAFAAFNTNTNPPRSHYSPNTRPRGPNSTFNPNSQYQPRNPPFQARPFFRPPQPRPNHQHTNNSSRPRCQICGRNNHTALTCYQRMNYAYQGITPQTRLQAMAATATPPPIPTSVTTWYADSGATNHIINDLSNLSIHSPYTGDDQVSTASGATMPIHNVGSSTATPPPLGSYATSGFYVGESSVSKPY